MKKKKSDMFFYNLQKWLLFMILNYYNIIISYDIVWGKGKNTLLVVPRK